MNTTDSYAKIREALEMEVPAMRELPRDLVTVLRTEAKNQRTPPIDYVVAEDGGRMVHRPEPDIAMAELLEEAATALSSERAAHEQTKRERDEARRRRDEWRKKAEGFDEVRQALREKVGAPWPPNMSRALWAGIAADEKKRADAAEARLAQALKALEQIEQQLDYGQIDMAIHITRRALEGGE